MKVTACGLMVIGSLYVFSGIAKAGVMGPVAEEAVHNWVAAFSAGPVWTNGGKTQTFYLTPAIVKSYVADRSNRALFDAELFLGLQKSSSDTLLSQLGIAVAATGNANLSGEISDDADPTFNNFIYSYKIQHSHIALKGKFLLDMGYCFMPWLSGSLGVGFNRASSFTNTPMIFEAIVNPNFTSETTTAFTYTLGAGVQKTLNPCWQVGLGYEFADWGKSSLGRAPGQTLNSGIRQNHFYTNGVLLNLTHLI